MICPFFRLYLPIVFSLAVGGLSIGLWLLAKNFSPYFHNVTPENMSECFFAWI